MGKRKYITPIVAVEHYELTQSIAACTVKIGFLDAECVKNDPDATNEMKALAWDEVFHWFVACEDPVVNQDYGDGICYHTNIATAFSS